MGWMDNKHCEENPGWDKSLPENLGARPMQRKHATCI